MRAWLSAVAVVGLLNWSSCCFSWSEGGHHLIAVMALEELSADEQTDVVDILKAHPRFDADFKVPEKSGDIEKWLVGRAAYWPDVARSQKENNRPLWHYQLGSVLTIGDVKNVPSNSGPLPETATLETRDLHIAQALSLSRRILAEKDAPPAYRAIALCWLLHLVGDSHQPCHSGSMYVAGLFPNGDKGANDIPTVQAKNMHALWDQLLGPKFDAGDITRRSKELRTDVALWSDAERAAKTPGVLEPRVWLAESAELARSSVYTAEVLDPVNVAAKDGKTLEPIILTETYLKNAGRVAQIRAATAALRLTEILRHEVLAKP